MKENICIRIPMLPPRECSPNWRGHWSVRAARANEFRAMAKFMALEQTKFARPELLVAAVRITFTVREHRHIRDIDNAIASLKPAIDGCVDARIIRDDSPDCLSYGPVEYRVDKAKAPLTVLEFRSK